jgi:hypothetical protein
MELPHAAMFYPEFACRTLDRAPVASPQLAFLDDLPRRIPKIVLEQSLDNAARR